MSDRVRVWVGQTRAQELVEAAAAGGAELVELADAEAVVWSGGDPEALRAALRPGIRWVQLPVAGVETWLRAGVVDRDRMWTSAAGCYARAVAEHALALMLSAAKELHVLARARTWTTPPEPRTLLGATVSVVGAGGIGRELIRLLEPFGARVLAVNRSGRPVAGADVTVPRGRLGDVLPEADYVVVAAPATPDTAALIGAPELAAMKTGAWVLNIARGSLVDTDALVTALRSNWIRGASLDVTDPEPLPEDHELWNLGNVQITPHNAGHTPEYYERLADVVAGNAERYATGEDLENRVV